MFKWFWTIFSLGAPELSVPIPRAGGGYWEEEPLSSTALSQEYIPLNLYWEFTFSFF